jgi:hypothetical protein
MHRVPVRIGLGERSPLTTGRCHVEDRVEDAASIHFDRSAHRARRPLRRDKVGDEIPLLVAHVAVRRSPSLRHTNRVRSHGKCYAIAGPSRSVFPR